MTNQQCRLQDAPDVLTVTEAAKLLRLGRNAMYDLLKSGQLRSVRVGRKILVPKSAVVRWLDT